MTKHVTRKGVNHFFGERFDIFCRFAPNGAGTPVDQNVKGCSVARTNVGKFTITMDQAYAALVDHKVDVRLATVANVFAKLSTYDPNARTITLELFKLVAPGGGGDCTLTNVDITYNANNVVSVGLVFGGSKKDLEI